MYGAEENAAADALAASEISSESVGLTAPSMAGTYYYGACVDAVPGESDTTNNCLSAVSATVSAGGRGGGGGGAVGPSVPGAPAALTATGGG